MSVDEYDPVFTHDDCSVESIEPIDTTLLIDPYVPAPPDPIGDCVLNLATLPPMPPAPPLPTCTTLRVNDSSEIYVDAEAVEPSMTFSAVANESCDYDLFLRIALPPSDPGEASCPTFAAGDQEAYVDSELTEPTLSLAIVPDGDTCDFLINFSLAIPASSFDSDSFWQTVTVTNFGGVNINLSTTTNVFGGNIFGGPEGGSGLDLGLNLTLPVKPITVVTDVACDSEGNLTVCYQNVLVLGTSVRRCLPILCPPATCCPPCDVVSVIVTPAICGVNEFFLYREAGASDWYGLTVGTDETVVELRAYCLASRTFLDVYCGGSYATYLTGELFGVCETDSMSLSEQETTLFGVLTPSSNTDSLSCDCLFEATPYIATLETVCYDQSITVDACCYSGDVRKDIVGIEMNGGVGSSCELADFSGNLETNGDGWSGVFSPIEVEGYAPNVLVAVWLICHAEYYSARVVMTLEDGSAVSFEVVLTPELIEGEQYLTGSFAMNTIIPGCESTFSLILENPCEEEVPIDPSYCPSSFNSLTVTVTPEGCDPVVFVLEPDGPSDWSGSSAMGSCACPTTPGELWLMALACSEGNWVMALSAPTGDGFLDTEDLTVIATSPGLYMTTTGTMYCSEVLRNITVEVVENV